MARPLRLAFPGALLHLISRGNNRRSIFVDDLDRVARLEILAHVVERFGWRVYAWCLMGNHDHLVVEVPRGNLIAGMRQLNGLYAQRFNRRHHCSGHVFQARYRSILVAKESHLVVVCRYVVRNPVRAGICSDPAAWEWSSYRATAGLRTPHPAFAAHDVLAFLGGEPVSARRRYREFVLGPAEPFAVVGERIGSDDFLRRDFELEPPLPEIARVQIEPLPPTLDEIFARSDGVSVATAYRRHGYTMSQIAEHLGVHYATVSRRLRREEAAMRECKT
jgi:putative transposase